MKLPSFFHRKRETEQLTYRKLAVATTGHGPATWDEKTRSVDVVAATENPVMVFDFERYEVVPEVLLMSGCRLPMSRKIPLLDSHSKATSWDVIGSARSLSVSGDELLTKAFFSDKTEKARDISGLVQDGDITDFSIGYRVNKHVWVPAGKNQVINGRSFQGPLKVSTDWTPRELSVTPIGADEMAKARSLNERKTTMSFWSKSQEENQPQGTSPQGGQPQDDQIRAERSRIANLTGLTNRFHCEHLLQRFIDAGTSIEDAQIAVSNHIMSQPEPTPGFRGLGDPYGRVEIGTEAFQKRREAMIDGLALECLGGRLENPAPGSNLYRVRLDNLAIECLMAAGERRARELPPGRLFERAMTSSDFPLILGGGQNRILRAAFDEAPDTWFWVEITEGRDFKDMERLQLSEFSDFDEIPEGMEYKYGRFGESRETFRISTYGKMFTISRQAFINDDKAAFSRAPRAFGQASKRKIGDAVYSALLANAAMSDGENLFSEAHGNVGTSGAPAIDSLSEGRIAMRSQKGLLDTATLNIQPKYIISGVNLETDIDTLLNSVSLDDGGNAGIANPFYKSLEKIIEPRITSETAWYLAASASQCQHIELCFLNGQKYPYIETREGWSTDGLEMKARIDFGVGVIDHRGLFYNAGQ